MTFRLIGCLFILLTGIDGFLVRPFNNFLDYGRFISSDKKIYEDYRKFLETPVKNESMTDATQQKWLPPVEL